MAHGLELFSATGALRLGVSDRITRLLFRQYVPAGQSGSVHLPDIVPGRTAAFAVLRGPNWASVTPLVTLDEEARTVAWSPSGSDTSMHGHSEVVVLLYG